MVCDTVAIVAALVVGMRYAPMMQQEVLHWVSLSPGLALWGSGLLVGVLVFVGLTLIGIMLTRIVDTVGLGLINRAAGLFFGVLKAGVLLVPVTLLVSRFAPTVISQSVVLSRYADVLEMVTWLPNQAPF